MFFGNNGLRRRKTRASMDRKARTSGKIGEATVAGALSMLTPEYAVFNNVLLKWKSRNRVGSTQIDHLVVSPYGLFVIETKNHKGVIIGDLQNETWVQILQYAGKSFQFRNPFFQNQGHLNTLSKQLGIDMQCMCGIVVFSNPSVDLSNVNAPCVTPDYLYNTIMQYRTPIWSMEQTFMIANAVQELNKSSRYNDSQHIKYVNSIKRFSGRM